VSNLPSESLHKLEALGKKVVHMPAIWRLRALQQLARWGVREETLLIVMAALVGLITAGAAWCFEECVKFLQIHYFQALVQRFDLTGKWIFFLPFIPALGGLAMSLVRLLFRRANSSLHGLSSVLLSLIRDRGRLRATLPLETMFTSSLTIGTGGSAGPEAPIAIIGSGIGSIIASLAGISRTNSASLIGCGAAAGISAVFDAPIAGVLFAMEVMLRDFSVKTFTPIVISAVIATTAFHAMRPEDHAGVVRGVFELPSGITEVVFNFREIPNFIFLGIVCGLLALFLTWLMESTSDLFHHLKTIPPFFQPAVGAGLSGLCGVILILIIGVGGHLRTPGSWYVPIFASGYPTVLQTLTPDAYSQPDRIASSSTVAATAARSLSTRAASASTTPATTPAIPAQRVTLVLWVLLLLCLFKILATSFTLGGGGSGGVFAPAMFIGATAGGAVGIALHYFVPAVQPSVYALVGMGAILAAIIQAPLMGIILLFELTRNYQVMLPIMLSACTATVLYRAVMKESIYTIPLTKMGVRAGAAVGISALRRIGIDQLPHRIAAVAQPGQTLSEIVARSQATGASDYVVADESGAYLGLLNDEDVRAVMLAPESAPLLLVGEVMRTNVPPLKPTDNLEAAWDLFARHDVDQLAIVTSPPAGKPAITGLVDRADLMRRYHEELGG
jgi:CIC family chloride channel protein